MRMTRWLFLLQNTLCVLTIRSWCSQITTSSHVVPCEVLQSQLQPQDGSIKLSTVFTVCATRWWVSKFVKLEVMTQVMSETVSWVSLACSFCHKYLWLSALLLNQSSQQTMLISHERMGKWSSLIRFTRCSPQSDAFPASSGVIWNWLSVSEPVLLISKQL